MFHIIKITNKNVLFPLPSLSLLLFGLTRLKRVLATKTMWMNKIQSMFLLCARQFPVYLPAFEKVYDWGSFHSNLYLWQTNLNKATWEISQKVQDPNSINAIQWTSLRLVLVHIGLRERLCWIKKHYVYGNIPSNRKPGRNFADKDPR